jgi:hypothetical protein
VPQSAVIDICHKRVYVTRCALTQVVGNENYSVIRMPCPAERRRSTRRQKSQNETLTTIRRHTAVCQTGRNGHRSCGPDVAARRGIRCRIRSVKKSTDTAAVENVRREKNSLCYVGATVAAIIGATIALTVTYGQPSAR